MPSQNPFHWKQKALGIAQHLKAVIPSDAGEVKINIKWQVLDLNKVSSEKKKNTTLKTTQKIKLPLSLCQVPKAVLTYFYKYIIWN